MKILTIGNSFSQDATRYLHQIAKADKMELKVVNLYIGGCSLKTHYLNMLDDTAAYSFEFNGEATGIYVSIREALKSDDWDYITLQQVSSKSTDYDSFQPYLNALIEYAGKYSPKSKLLLHQTWAYEEGSERLYGMGYTKQSDMFADIKKAYNKASEETGLEIIPSGEAFQLLIKNGIEKIHRDTFHASMGIGRYTLGLVWYKYLTGNSIENNSFRDFDCEVSEDEVVCAKKWADEAVSCCISPLR